MSSNNRKTPYSLAVNEALTQIMEKDSSVFVLGQGTKSPWYVGDTCKDLIKKFGESRVIDTPISENAMAGAGVGAATAGMKPVVIFPRLDFMLYAFDSIINEAANWHYMFGGKSSVPVVFWGIINRGGEQAAQHSQALQAIFCHIPGLKVVAPSNAYDAKGLMVSAINDGNPVVFIDDRWLYDLESEVPEEIYKIPIGRGDIKKEGKDITLISSSYVTIEALKAAEELEKEGIGAEVLDLRTLKPLDKGLIFKSVRKTGRVVIVDVAWKSFGAGAEIAALIAENIPEVLKAPIKRVALPDAPAPASSVLEKVYYPNQNDIIKAVRELIKKNV